MKIYLAWHDYHDQYYKEHILLGAFSSEAKARKTIPEAELAYLQLQELELDALANG